MKIRRWWLIAVGAIVVAIFGLSYFAFREDESDPIRYANYEQIQIGMSSNGVEDLLGPERHYENGQIWISMCDGKRSSPTFQWEGYNNKITVTYRNGVVESKTIENTSLQNLFGSAKRCLGLGQSPVTFVSVPSD